MIFVSVNNMLKTVIYFQANYLPIKKLLLILKKKEKIP